MEKKSIFIVLLFFVLIHESLTISEECARIRCDRVQRCQSGEYLLKGDGEDQCCDDCRKYASLGESCEPPKLCPPGLHCADNKKCAPGNKCSSERCTQVRSCPDGEYVLPRDGNDVCCDKCQKFSRLGESCNRNIKCADNLVCSSNNVCVKPDLNCATASCPTISSCPSGSFRIPGNRKTDCCDVCRRFAQRGEMCHKDKKCAPGLFCNEQHICAPVVTCEGEATRCPTITSCPPGKYLVPKDMITSCCDTCRDYSGIGQFCNANYRCASGLNCNEQNICEEPVVNCAAVSCPRVRSCPEGEYLVPADGIKHCCSTCRKYSKLGEPCNNYQKCGKDLVCNADNVCASTKTCPSGTYLIPQTGECVRYAGYGESCAEIACGPEFYCNTAKRCTPIAKPDCAVVICVNEDRCPANQYIVPADGIGVCCNYCKRYAGLGENCELPQLCSPELHCDGNKKCVAGSQCSTERCTPVRSCPAGEYILPGDGTDICCDKCQKYSGLGEACNRNIKCADNLICSPNNVCTRPDLNCATVSCPLTRTCPTGSYRVPADRKTECCDTCRRYAQRGEMCHKDKKCAPGLFCNEQHVCAPVINCEGERCPTITSCPPGKYLVPKDLISSCCDICRDYSAVGQFCDAQHPCARGLNCNERNICEEPVVNCATVSCPRLRFCPEGEYLVPADGIKHCCNTCRKYSRLGEPCDNYQKCGKDLVCNADNVCASTKTCPSGTYLNPQNGECIRYAGYGESCAQIACGPEFYCNTAKRCTPVGKPDCALVRCAGVERCPANQYIVPADGIEVCCSYCQNYAALGENCELPQLCLPELHCDDNKKCAAGSHCSADRCTPVRSCPPGQYILRGNGIDVCCDKCQKYSDLGEPCNRNINCAGNLICSPNNVCVRPDLNCAAVSCPVLRTCPSGSYRVPGDRKTECCDTCRRFAQRGEMCHNDKRCAPGLFCNQEHICDPGINCEGERCPTITSCPAGKYLVPKDMISACCDTCRDYSGIGQFCDAQYPCARGLNCNENNICEDPVVNCAAVSCPRVRSCPEGEYLVPADGIKQCCNICRKYSMLGEPCDNYQKCGKDLVCNANNVCVSTKTCPSGTYLIPQTGECVRYAGYGESCVEIACGPKFYCSIGKRCTPIGKPDCALVKCGRVDRCPANQYMVPADGIGVCCKYCETYATLGENCELPQLCSPELHCDNKKCVSGSHCSVDRCTPVRSCPPGQYILPGNGIDVCCDKCQKYSRLGEPCNRDIKCADNLICTPSNICAMPGLNCEGISCTVNLSCPKGFYRVPADRKTECCDTCRRYAQRGEMCHKDKKCAPGLFCGDQHVCDQVLNCKDIRCPTITSCPPGKYLVPKDLVNTCCDYCREYSGIGQFCDAQYPCARGLTCNEQNICEEPVVNCAAVFCPRIRSCPEGEYLVPADGIKYCCNTCRKYSKFGEPCDMHQKCGRDLACNADNVCASTKICPKGTYLIPQTGKCVKYAGYGESCAQIVCGPEYYCNFAKRCTPNGNPDCSFVKCSSVDRCSGKKYLIPADGIEVCCSYCENYADVGESCDYNRKCLPELKCNAQKKCETLKLDCKRVHCSKIRGCPEGQHLVKGGKQECCDFCRKNADLGQPCSHKKPCNEGLFCNRDDVCEKIDCRMVKCKKIRKCRSDSYLVRSNGVTRCCDLCREYAEEGEYCDPTHPCEPMTLRCDEKTDACVPSCKRPPCSSY